MSNESATTTAGERENLDRPVVVVTGAAGGMGSAIVTDLSRDRHVIALGRSAESLERYADEPHIETRVVDLLDPASFPAVIESLRGADGSVRIDGIVHVAAVAVRYSVETSTVEAWNEHLGLNVVAPAELTRLALPALRASEGTVVFINSGAGEKAGAGHAVYSASKFALTALADSLRLEESEAGVRVSTVSPGPTDTKMLRADFERRGAEWKPEQYIAPASVAAAVRLVLDATPDTQITKVSVRPRRELG